MNVNKKMALIGSVLSSISAIIALTLTVTYKLSSWTMSFETWQLVLVPMAVVLTVVISILSWTLYNHISNNNNTKNLKPLMFVLGILSFWQLGAGFFFLASTVVKEEKLITTNVTN